MSEVQTLMQELSQKAEVGFEHVEAVVKRLLHKLHLDADNDAANAKKHIEELAAAVGRNDVVLPAPAAPEASPAATPVTAAATNTEAATVADKASS
jgi:hypothetical protein